VADASDQAVEPVEPRRRPWRWAAAALVLVAVIALAAWGISTLLDDSPEEQWEACAERVDPPAARSARIRELTDAEDKEAARDRLAQETGEVQRRIEAECGERP
jgi:hypothetical protein